VREASTVCRSAQANLAHWRLGVLKPSGPQASALFLQRTSGVWPQPQLLDVDCIEEYLPKPLAFATLFTTCALQSFWNIRLLSSAFNEHRVTHVPVTCSRSLLLLTYIVYVLKHGNSTTGTFYIVIAIQCMDTSAQEFSNRYLYWSKGNVAD
jgi:hypothetical protein